MLKTYMTLAAVGLVLAACANTTDVPNAYLLQARQAVHDQQGPQAIAAIDHAQSEWLSRNQPSTNIFNPVEPPVLREMARAKQSVEMQRWSDAEYYVNAALSDPSTLTPGAPSLH